MLGLDTNIVLRWLIDESIWPNDNPGQIEAVRALLSNEDQTFYVNSVVLHETLWVVSKLYKQPKAVLVDLIERLLLSTNLVVQDREAVEATWRSYAAHSAGVHDRLIAEINALAGCKTTMTFDRAASRTPGFQLLHDRG
jgi:predicted nucleic-acid-binding protein